MPIKPRLSVLHLLQYAVWGAYLISMGTFLSAHGMASRIGVFYSVQGFVSLFMPALMGMVADRWIQAQRLLGACHLISACCMLLLCAYGILAEEALRFTTLFGLYACSVFFFMPTIALSYSVSYNALEKEGADTVKTFPSIRIWGSIGFIASMWVVDLGGMQASALQFGWSGMLGLMLGLYAFSMPPCPMSQHRRRGLSDILGLRAFRLFRDSRMALFFVFSMLVGICLQISNGFVNPFLSSFAAIERYADTFGVQHANILISLSQMSETLCILLIPFFMRRLGAMRVMLIAILSWSLRYGLLAIGNPGSGVWLFVLSMLLYGVAFDFFHISGSLFVNAETDASQRSSAQGLFMMMTNGFGTIVGTLSAQHILSGLLCLDKPATPADPIAVWQGWSTFWLIFAAYAFTIAIAFALCFRYHHKPSTR